MAHPRKLSLQPCQESEIMLLGKVAWHTAEEHSCLSSFIVSINSHSYKPYSTLGERYANKIAPALSSSNSSHGKESMKQLGSMAAS